MAQLPTPMMATRTLSLERALPFVEPLVAAMGVSFPRPPPKGTDRRRFDWKGTPSSSESAARMTSFVLEPRRNASAWIADLSSSGMRRSTTGLEPGSGLRRFVGRHLDVEGVGEDADGDVVEARSPAGGLADESLLQGGRRPNEDALAWRSASSQTASSIAVQQRTTPASLASVGSDETVRGRDRLRRRSSLASGDA